jgi:hypothetical protein
MNEGCTCEDFVQVVDPVRYVNGAEIAMTPFDFAVRLRSCTGGPEEGVITLQMTPEFAHCFMLMLERSLQDYRETIGPIRDLRRTLHNTKEAKKSREASKVQ